MTMTHHYVDTTQIRSYPPAPASDDVQGDNKPVDPEVTRMGNQTVVLVDLGKAED